jgi:hypothetical protein
MPILHFHLLWAAHNASERNIAEDNLDVIMNFELIPSMHALEQLQICYSTTSK